jgi:heme/copper-type cytochrome/quinol oxidase subunit 2
MTKYELGLQGREADMGNQAERLEVAMLWLSFLSFGAGLTLTAIAAYYGSIFMALMAIFSFMMGVLFYFIYREPALSEDANSSDEMKKREAIRETVFLISLLLATMFSYAALANVFYDTFSNTEEIAIIALPSSLGLVWLGAFLYVFLKTGPEPLPQPEENKDRQ